MRRGIAPPTLDPHGSTNSLRMSDPSMPRMSYVVSNSGGTFSLQAYDISSAGAQIRTSSEIQELGVSKSTSATFSCKHVEELDYDNAIKIGAGSSGKVWDVRHRPTGRRVCVKQMSVDEARQREEIKKELDMLHNADSKWIVEFYGAFFHHEYGQIWLVLEKQDGSFLDVLKHRPVLAESDIKAVVFQALSGIAYLHSSMHLIHRDIKPSNLLFNASGQIKIADFGVSSGRQPGEPQSAQTFVGSVLYMSPERLQGQSYTFNSDVWSLGVLVYEAVSGVHPYQDPEDPSPPIYWDLVQKMSLATDPPELPEAIKPTVSPELQDFLKCCLATDRYERAGAEQLLQHPWLAGMTEAQSLATVHQMVGELIAINKQKEEQLPAARERSHAALNEFVRDLGENPPQM